MSFDPATLLISTVVISMTVGVLLIFAWAQNPAHRALAMWGAADVLGAIGTVLLMTRGYLSDFISIGLAFEVVAVCYALIWAAGRAFSNRPLRPIAMAAGPVIWLVACTIPAVFRTIELRAPLISIIIATYTLATAWELWRDRGEHLLSRYPAVACLCLHGTLLLARGAMTLIWTLPPTPDMLKTPWVAALALEPMIIIMICGFLQLSMAKERTEQVQRRAAATDELTGIASRRAFLDQGERRLAAAVRQGVPVALLLLDLDHFKQINDSYGHETGDRVLQTFARRAVEVLRPGDLFGRIGGEEFAALLTHTSGDAALTIAERFRAAVERIDFREGDIPLHLSVSVGVSSAAGLSCELGDMMRQADRALYGAKSAGRNCVQQRRLSATPRLRAV